MKTVFGPGSPDADGLEGYQQNKSHIFLRSLLLTAGVLRAAKAAVSDIQNVGLLKVKFLRSCQSPCAVWAFAVAIFHSVVESKLLYSCLGF